MRVLISGSEGALGSILKAELRSQGHDVYGCDLAHTNDSQVMRTDVSIRRQVDRAFEWAKPDLVYWLAAEFGRLNGRDYYEQLFSTNMIGMQNGIEACIKSKAAMVFASSSEAYGLANQYTDPGTKLREELLDTNVPMFHNNYALSKYCNERQIFTAAANDGLDAIVLRFFNVYGPGEKFSPYRSVACQFLYRALTGMPITVHQESRRSHLYVYDWVKTVASVAEKFDMIKTFPRRWRGSGNSGVPAFNIASEENVSNEVLLDKIFHVVGSITSEVTYLPAEEQNIATKDADCGMAKIWLGHKAETSLLKGLEGTCEWMKEYYGL